MGRDPGERGWHGCWKSGLEPHAECGWCCEAVKHRDFGGSSRGNGRYLLSECFPLKQGLERFRTAAKGSIAAVILSNIRRHRVNCPQKGTGLSWNHLGWSSPSRSLSSTVNPALPPLTISPKATSTHLLNLSRDGDSTIALHSLFHCLTTLSVNKFPPILLHPFREF